MNAERVFGSISAAALRVGRDPNSITLCAVSKKQPLEKMLSYIEYCTKHGKKIVFGENYVQEYREKKLSISQSVEVHLIGHLQSNKSKEAVELFDCIESVDSIALANKLNTAAKQIGTVLPVFLQINISQDPAKSGVVRDGARSTCEKILKLSSLSLRGLMTITELYAVPEEARKDFAAMRDIRDRLLVELGLEALELSMGMSDDFEYAIEEGADIVRVGSALFGVRS